MAEEGQNQPEFPPKRIRFAETRDLKDEDRISMLPDCLLVEIVSRLHATKCAIRTGALSKRWKNIWTSVPNLNFSHCTNPNADFISFVDKTLTQRGQLKLKKFSVYARYDHQFEPQIHNWIRYVIDCKVEKLKLMLLCDWESEFLLDHSFFINSCFTVLTLCGCIFNPVKSISWTKIKRLRIHEGSLDEDLIENILSGSPVLETLELENCFGYKRLNITSKSVKKLVFDGYNIPRSYDDLYYELEDYIEINAPNILSLTIQDDLRLSKLLLVNVSSLVEADLDYKLCGDYEIARKVVEEEMLKQFLIKLHHVKELNIGIYCYRALARLKAKGFIFPSNLEVPDLSSYSYESDNDSSEISDHSYSFESDNDSPKISDRSDGDSDDDGPTGDEIDGEDDDDIASSDEEMILW